MKNLISVFEEERVTIIKDDEMNAEIAWYDITDIIRKLLGGKSSVLEYVKKVEMEIYRFYRIKSCGSDRMSIVRDEFLSRIKPEACRRFMCVKEGNAVSAFNDAGSIRLTFSNGSVLISSNSEWGGIEMMQADTIE